MIAELLPNGLLDSRYGIMLVIFGYGGRVFSKN
jgi:hypothetical protein